MENVNDKIQDEIVRAMDELKHFRADTEEYRKIVDAIAVLQKSRLEEERNHDESLFRAQELALKEEEQSNRDRELNLKEKEQTDKLVEQADEKKKFIIRAVIDTAAIVVPAALYAFFGVKGFKFEERGTFCSNTHKQNFANIFKFRR